MYIIASPRERTPLLELDTMQRRPSTMQEELLSDEQASAPYAQDDDTDGGGASESDEPLSDRGAVEVRDSQLSGAGVLTLYDRT